MKHKSILDKLFYNKDLNTFFGLDSVISIWHILELQHNILKYPSPVNGYLYEIQIVKDLPVTNIINKLLLDDEFDKIFEEKNKVCVKPQIGFHKNIRCYKGVFESYCFLHDQTLLLLVFQ